MKNKTLLEIGHRLRHVRKEKGYTQEQLAGMTGLSVKMLSAAENGQKAMRPENIIKICECLSISADYLLCGESPELKMMVGQREISRLTPKQKEALSRIIADFLIIFDDSDDEPDSD